MHERVGQRVWTEEYVSWMWVRDARAYLPLLVNSPIENETQTKPATIDSTENNVGAYLFGKRKKREIHNNHKKKRKN